MEREPKHPKRQTGGGAVEPYDAELESLLLDQSSEYAVSYAHRGRRFASLSDGELREAWIRAYEAWCHDPYNGTKDSTRKDLDAEFGLRGLDPPSPTVLSAAAKEAFSALCQRVLNHLKDPKQSEKVATETVDEMREYRSRRERTSN